MDAQTKQIALLAPVVLLLVAIAVYRGDQSIGTLAAIYIGSFLAWWQNR